MNIVLASDDQFVPHLATAMHSAWFHNRKAEFYLLDCGIAPANAKALTAFATETGIPLTILKVDIRRLSGFPLLSRGSVACYARLLLPSVMPDDCDRAIYLDSDCIVMGDLASLWATDVSHHLLAGVRDIQALQNEKRKYRIEGRDSYVNSGVMLINLKAWRASKFQEAAFAFVRGRTELLHVDQTIINAIADARIKIVPEEWNFMPSLIASIEKLPDSPKIVHYAGPCKPWLHSDAMFAQHYFFHRDATPYPFERPTSRYRSVFRVVLNLMLLRKKYWRQMLAFRRYHHSPRRPT